MRFTMDKAHRHFKAGMIVWTVWINPHSDHRRGTMNLEVYTRSQFLKGRRKHENSYSRLEKSIPSVLLNGTFGYYFNNERSAERYAQEIRDGLHPGLVSAALGWEYECDVMDELTGTCDRDLGGFVDPDIYENYAEYDYRDSFDKECLQHEMEI